MTGMSCLAAVCMAALGTYYFLNKKKHRRRALACKALATLIPSVLVFCSLPAADDPAGLRIVWAYAGTLAAVLFYAAADILLECRFAAGAVCFSVGHICMAGGFLLGGETGFISENGKTDLSALACLAGLFLLFTGCAYLVLGKYLILLKAKGLMIPAAAYIGVLSLMAALAAVSGIQSGTAAGQITAAGGICFVVSDILLGKNRLGRKRSRKRGAAVLILYYLSVYLLSMRLWYA